MHVLDFIKLVNHRLDLLCPNSIKKNIYVTLRFDIRYEIAFA